MLQVAGVDRVITMDLHATQIQGFFDVPVDNLLSEPTLTKYIMNNVEDYRDGVVVAKNAGAAKRVTSFADRLKIDFAIIHHELPNGNNDHDYDNVHDNNDSDINNNNNNNNNNNYSLVSSPDLESSRRESSLTVVGDVKGKVSFILVSDHGASYI